MSMEALEEYKGYLRELHVLDQAGKFETPEYEAVTDKMDGSYFHMTQEEVQLANQYAAELFG